MMRSLTTLLTGTAVCVLMGASSAYARSAEGDAGAVAPTDEASVQPGDAPDSNSIVVTARRRDEVIQDVPLTIQAVSGSTLQKLDLFQFQDLGKVIPGITLDRSQNAITIRGVSFNTLQRTNPTVSTYFNEAPLQSSFLFQSLFDIGQIEVLKGPQGTLRGQSAPSGAIILNAARPNLHEIGAYASSTVTNQDGRTIQSAISVPIIDGKFSLRFAGISDRNNYGGVKSLNNNADPYSDTTAYRITALIEPVDNLSAVLTYQHLFNKSLDFGLLGSPNAALFGSGAPGGTITAGGYSKPYVQVTGSNGPVIPIGENASVAENGDYGRVHQQVATAQIDYKIAGQKLSYVGSWSRNTNSACCNYADKGNLILGDFNGVNVGTNLTRWTHELRLSSDQRVAGIFDYVVGVFHEHERSTNNVNTGPVAFLPGAFGSPLGAPSAIPPNQNYTISVLSNLTSKTDEWSYFANLVAHLGDKTELSGGVRFINSTQDNFRENISSAAKLAVALPFPCSFASLAASTDYPGACETSIPGSDSTSTDHSHSTPTVYSATLSHHFTRDFLGYVSFGTSWRPGPVQGGIVNGANDPIINNLLKLKDETTKSYEAGIKTSVLDGRLTFDFAYYHQNYKNLVYAGGTVPYLADATGGGCVVAGSCSIVSQTNIVSNIDAKVDGIDLDFSFAMSNRFHLSGGLSYANGKFNNQAIPCNDGNFDGVPDTTTPTVAGFTSHGIHIATCRISGKSMTTASWTGTLQPEYTQPINDRFDAFISGLLTYTSKNPNQPGSVYTTPAYALLDLHAGVRGSNGNWQLEVFAKNIFNNRTILTKGFTDVASSGLTNIFGGSGYQSISYVLPREIGVSLRVAFGSR